MQTKLKTRKITVGTFGISETTIDRISQLLRSGRISQGKYVAEFEKYFADFHGMEDCVAVSTGTAADTLALAIFQDWKAKKDHEVVLPALTFVSCANSVLHAGFKPVFADINPETYQIDPEQAERVVTSKTAAVMPVHLFGRPAPMNEILDLGKRRSLPVIEDAAEAHGAKYHGKLVGTMGDMGTYSFYVAHIVTSGEGGAVITNNTEYGQILRSLRAHGRTCTCKSCVLNTGSHYCAKRFAQSDIDTRFYFERVGYSEKMNEMEALLGLDQVHELANIVKTRRKHLAFLIEDLLPFQDVFQLFQDRPGEEISPLCFPIMIREKAGFTRSEITAFLEKRGIETRPMFNSIPTQQPAYRFLGYSKGQFPNAERVGERGFYVGCHQHLTQDDLEFMVESFRDFLKR